MTILGLVVSIFVFSTVLILFLVYVGASFFKKYKFAYDILPYLFLHLIFSVTIEFWALVVMNKSFDIIFDIGVDFTMLLFLEIPVFILFVICENIHRRKFQLKGIRLFSRFLLPIATFVLFVIALGLFYFNCQYFVFLKTW